MSETLFTNDEVLHLDNQVIFAMEANGFDLVNNKWEFKPDDLSATADGFVGQQVTLFGPTAMYKSQTPTFFYVSEAGAQPFHLSFDQQPVIDLVTKLRKSSDEKAQEVSYILGGLVRHMSAVGENPNKIKQAVRFCAQMIKVGDEKSVFSIAMSMAAYVLSRGKISEDIGFIGDVYRMAQAVSEDKVVLNETKDLGLYQLSRLYSFSAIINGARTPRERELPDISDELKAIDGFPTVGAEFHFPMGKPKDPMDFKQRLALLNMSQYRGGNFV